MFIVITKSSNGAISHIGPFESEKVAYDFATARYGRTQPWWIANVSTPADQYNTYTLFDGLNAQ